MSIFAIARMVLRVIYIINPNAQLLTATIVNGFWASLNAYAMTVLIGAALWRPKQ